jgi:hypothetical protein
MKRAVRWRGWAGERSQAGKHSVFQLLFDLSGHYPTGIVAARRHSRQPLETARFIFVFSVP